MRGMWFLFFLTAAMAIAGEFRTSRGDTIPSFAGGGVLSGDFTTSLGDQYPYTISAITTDSYGNTYVVGSRQLGGPAPGSTDVFVSKLDSLGDLYFTDTFAGKGFDIGTAIALDPAGNIYIAGTTTSNDFPLSSALQTQPYASGTGFIVKLTFDGSTILYSTYFGGTLGSTSISSLATDSSGNLYLTGTTTAADFPHTAGMPSGAVSSSEVTPISGAIVVSISAAGDKILYSGVLAGTALTCFGGSSCTLASRITSGASIGVDAACNAYVAGNTNTTDLPTTSGAVSPTGFGAFVAKVKPAGAGLSYLTYLSPGQLGVQGLITGETTLNAITVDAAGNAYLAGSTNDSTFPATPSSLQPFFGGPPPLEDASAPPEGFLAKLKPDGSAMLWATFLGGAGPAAAQSISVDAGGNVWAVGVTQSSTFPNTNGWTTGPEFLIGLNATGSELTYSALYPSGTVAQAVAVDLGMIHIAGSNGFVSATSPPPFTGPGLIVFAFQNGFGGNVTARISPAEVISIYGPGIGPSTPSTATPTNGFYPTTLAGVQVAINGMNMPLLYVSANQINAVVPMEIAPGAAATVHVIDGVVLGPAYPVWIVDSAPQAFATVLNQDGAVNAQTNPAQQGSIVTFYATGWQTNFSPLADGQVATMAQNICPEVCQAVPAGSVFYGGSAPGIVAGVSQLNVQIGTIQSSSTSPFLYGFSMAGPSGDLSQTVWVTP
jgi:uncharacterized protein (TIGR03437 family)